MCMYVCYVHEVVVLCTAFPWMPACLEDRSRPPLGLGVRGARYEERRTLGPVRAGGLWSKVGSAWKKKGAAGRRPTSSSGGLTNHGENA